MPEAPKMFRPTQSRFLDAPMGSLPARRALRFAEILCWLVAAAALSWFLFVSVNAHLFQARELRRFYSARGNAPPVRPPAPGDVVGKLTIPRIQFDAVALEGDDDKTLRRAVGHIPGTSYPDASGTAAFAGHRDTFFRRLGEL
jgi:LPXTG-site transpeptidase (sortase) family protein